VGRAQPADRSAALMSGGGTCCTPLRGFLVFLVFPVFRFPDAHSARKGDIGGTARLTKRDWLEYGWGEVVVLLTLFVFCPRTAYDHRVINF
jgi:hypothetical protein